MSNEELDARAAARPLSVCMNQRLGHEVGIPPGLRDYRDKVFDFLPGSVRVVVEIGTLQGWFAWRCMKFLPEDAVVFCVDSFEDSALYPGRYNLKCWRKNLAKWIGKRVFLRRGDSAAEAARFGSEIDVLFIDGDHTTEGVLRDLRAWVPLVRKGGLIVGHDIEGPWGQQVQAALDKFRGEGGINEYRVHRTMYSFTGKQETPCWWTLK